VEHKLTPSPDLHTPQTTANLLALLVAPITSYLSVLTLLAIPSYTPLLSSQPYSTRMAIGQAVVSSVLKNNTLIETSEDVSGVLGLCAVLVRDQKDSTSASGPRGRHYREMAEEQGWVARMVHLFKSDDLAVQFEVSLTFHVGRSQADV
jgi:vacuolar protein sorting-associated protein 35